MAGLGAGKGERGTQANVCRHLLARHERKFSKPTPSEETHSLQSRPSSVLLSP